MTTRRGLCSASISPSLSMATLLASSFGPDPISQCAGRQGRYLCRRRLEGSRIITVHRVQGSLKTASLASRMVPE